MSTQITVDGNEVIRYDNDGQFRNGRTGPEAQGFQVSDDLSLPGLNRRCAEPRIAERETEFLHRVSGGMNRNRMVVRVDSLKVAGELANPIVAEV